MIDFKYKNYLLDGITEIYYSGRWGCDCDHQTQFRYIKENDNNWRKDYEENSINPCNGTHSGIDWL